MTFPLNRLCQGASRSLTRKVAPLKSHAAAFSGIRTISGDKTIDIMHQSHRLHSGILAPLNDRVLGPLENSGQQDKLTSLPFVFLLGNHSSGKSTFINHVLGREVQKTGVAPTDDGFTIIAPGDKDLDQDGPALIGNPDMGFGGLRSFGPSLIQRTQLKIRSEIGSDFMLVDSPGMIDSPTSHTTVPSLPQQYHTDPSSYSARNRSHLPSSSSSLRSQSELSDRGYDFREVTRWFAERADVILLFFDPDKPGTTGETLEILTSSLLGMDHKLHIILNKVDQFEKIHDFARAYGSLCWNLSKVIPRKDLPRIYTMCTPLKQKDGSINIEALAENHGLGAALKDLDSTRDEVMHEVFRAPERRVDNVITRLYDSTRLIQMHAQVFEHIRQTYSRELWTRRMFTGAAVCGSGALITSSVLGGAPIHLSVTLSVVSMGAIGMVVWNNQKQLKRLREDLVSVPALEDVFKRLYGRELVEGNEFVLSLWKRVLPQLQLALDTIGLDNIPKVKAIELDSLARILDIDVPNLRRSAAPDADSSLAHKVANMFRSRN